MLANRRLASVITGIALAAGASLAFAPAADASTQTAVTVNTGHPKPLGTKPLTSVLLASPPAFDHNWHDYDILTSAVVAVLKAKPNSPVKVLTDGNVAVTAFLPSDAAFQRLAKDISGSWVPTEQGVFTAVAGLGIDTVETVLLYHVIPGATITAKQALKADQVALTTAQGGKITVQVRHEVISIKDADKNNRDPRVNVVNINAGNKQIAHGINRVLRPVDLPN